MKGRWTFLIILEVTEILRSFRLVLKGRTGKEMPESSKLKFSETFLANNFALYTEDNTSGPLNRGDMADLPLLKTQFVIRQKSRQRSLWEVIDSVWLAYASLAASRTFKKACLNLFSDSEDLVCWYKRKTLWQQHTWGLTRSLRWGIYTSISTWTHSQNSLAAADARRVKLSSHGTSLKWSRRPSQSARE